MQENTQAPEVSNSSKASYQKPTLEVCGNWESLTTQFIDISPD